MDDSDDDLDFDAIDQLEATAAARRQGNGHATTYWQPPAHQVAAQQHLHQPNAAPLPRPVQWQPTATAGPPRQDVGSHPQSHHQQYGAFPQARPPPQQQHHQQWAPPPRAQWPVQQQHHHPAAPAQSQQAPYAPPQQPGGWQGAPQMPAPAPNVHPQAPAAQHAFHQGHSNGPQWQIHQQQQPQVVHPHPPVRPHMHQQRQQGQQYPPQANWQYQAWLPPAQQSAAPAEQKPYYYAHPQPQQQQPLQKGQKGPQEGVQPPAVQPTQRSLYSMWQQQPGRDVNTPAGALPAQFSNHMNSGGAVNGGVHAGPTAGPQPPTYAPAALQHQQARQQPPVQQQQQQRQSVPQPPVQQQQQQPPPPQQQQQLYPALPLHPSPQPQRPESKPQPRLPSPQQASVREAADEVLPASEGGPLLKCPTTTGGLRLHSMEAAHWVYPAGVPERAYQLSCIRTALLANTLVCLPTGLGKTLIAAVVMHNFTRWFPEGKVVFLAPTRPLVAQQISACRRFMGLLPSAAAELTGSTKAEARKDLWLSPSTQVFFCTPQTFWNDVKRGICPYEAISCLVVDECHRATGNTDIVSAVKHMRELKRLKFRVVGLSATPGSNLDQVQEVLSNLGLSALEFRSEGDADVAPYVFVKRVVKHVVPSGEEQAGGGPRPSLLAVLRQLLGHLAAARVYFGALDAERVTRFGLMQAQRAAVTNAGGGAAGCGSTVASRWFRQAQLLADLRDQLDDYGVTAALTYLNTKVAEAPALRELASSSPVFSHFVRTLGAAVTAGGSARKMQKLVEVLRGHFEAVAAEQAAGDELEGRAGGGADTPAVSGRVIVFTNLREGVTSILEALKQHEPLVQARAFIGQGGGRASAGGGMKQKEQKEVLDGFRKGAFNVLVATCIGEEGLDIPAVDLIVCYDATASPTRAQQRQGRTGRHREGLVVYILSAGREEEAFERIAESTKQLHAQLRDPARHFTLYSPNPRMLPRQFDPERLDVAVAVQEQEEAPQRKSKQPSGRGQASRRGSGKGRGSAAVAGGGGVEPIAEAAEEFAALVATAGADRRGRGRGRTSGRGRGRVGAVARKALVPLLLDEEEEEEEDGSDSEGLSDGWERRPARPSPPASPLPSQQGPAAGREEQEEERPGGRTVAESAPRQPLFSRSAAAISWSRRGGLTIAAPPALSQLLAPQPPAALAALQTPAQLQRTPVLVDGTREVELPQGKVLRFDPGEHRWAGLAAANALPKPPPPPPAAPGAPAGEAAPGKTAAAGVGRGNAVKPGKKATKPRKRKAPAAAAAAAADPAAADPAAAAADPAAAAVVAQAPLPVNVSGAAAVDASKRAAAEHPPLPVQAQPCAPNSVEVPASRVPGAIFILEPAAALAQGGLGAVAPDPTAQKQSTIGPEVVDLTAGSDDELCVADQEVAAPGEALATEGGAAAAAAAPASLSHPPLVVQLQQRAREAPQQLQLTPPCQQDPPGQSNAAGLDLQQLQEWGGFTSPGAGQLSCSPRQITLPSQPPSGLNAANQLPEPGIASEGAALGAGDVPGYGSWAFDDGIGCGFEDGGVHHHHDFYEAVEDDVDALEQQQQEEEGGIGLAAATGKLAGRAEPLDSIDAGFLSSAEPPVVVRRAGGKAPALRRVILDSPGGTQSLPVPCSAPTPAHATESPAASLPAVEPPRQRVQLNRLRKGSTAPSLTALIAHSPFDAAAQAAGQPRRPPARQQPTAKRLRAATFLDVEAALSGDDDGLGDEEEDGVDGYEGDFIDDATQPSTHGTTQRPTGGSSPSLAGFYRRRLLEEDASPSPGEVLARLKARRLGRNAAAALDSPMVGGGEDEDDDYEEDSFIDNGQDGEEAGEEGTNHDDECGVCGGIQGRLLCCDGCPGAFHLPCLGLAAVPEGDWFCAMCLESKTPVERGRG